MSVLAKLSGMAGMLARVMRGLPRGIKAIPIEKKYGRTFAGDWRGNVNVKLKWMFDNFRDSPKDAANAIFQIMKNNGGTLGKKSSGGLMSGSEPTTKSQVLKFIDRVGEITGVDKFPKVFVDLHKMAKQWFDKEARQRKEDVELSPRALMLVEAWDRQRTSMSYLLERLTAPTRTSLERLVFEAVAAGYDGKAGAPHDVVYDRVFGFVRDVNIAAGQIDSMLRRGLLTRGQDGELYVA